MYSFYYSICRGVWQFGIKRRKSADDKGSYRLMRWLGKVLQPEVFNDYSMSQELKSFYHNYLKYDLSEEEVNDILKSNVNPVIPTL